MRYDYKCPGCGAVKEVRHRMGAEFRLNCDGCGTLMRTKITSVAMVHFAQDGLKGRSLLRRDRPTNREYQAYKAWEAAGGEPGTPEHREYLHVKGEL